jgi:hypothetical protein
MSAVQGTSVGGVLLWWLRSELLCAKIVDIYFLLIQQSTWCIIDKIVDNSHKIVDNLTQIKILPTPFVL